MDSHPETPQWTADRLAALAPAWEPDLGRARTLLRPARRTRRRGTLYAVAAATAALVVAFASPSGRALAQDLWYRWFITRVAVVRLEFSKLPLDSHVDIGAYRAVSSVADAAAVAGFTPSLPPASVAGGEPELSVIGRIEVTQRIRTGDLEAALRREGVSDVAVPPEWNGVTLRGVIGPIVYAAYPGNVQVLQTTPIRLEMPADFPLERFADVAFRCTGLPWWEARQLAEDYARQPALLLDVPANADLTIETVPLPGGGTGLLILDPHDTEQEHAKVIISRHDRLYAVTSPDRDLTLRVAAALP